MPGKDPNGVQDQRPRMAAELPDGLVYAVESVEFAGTRRRLLKHSILRAQLLRLALRGLTAKQACEVVGCGYQTARNVYRDPEFRAKALSRVEGALAYADETFNRQNQSLHARLAEKSEKAFDVLCEMLENTSVNPGLRVRVAQDFLDRNPDTSQTQKHEHSHQHNFSADELRRAAETAREMVGAGPRLLKPERGHFVHGGSSTSDTERVNRVLKQLDERRERSAG